MVYPMPGKTAVSISVVISYFDYIFMDQRKNFQKPN